MGNVIAAFSEDQVQRMTGISKRQLRYWDNTDFFSPTFDGEEWDSSIGRVYSFRDIISLRVLNSLRNEQHVSLHHLREVGEKLSQDPDEKWTGVRLYAFNKRVVWLDPGAEKPQEVLSGQYLVHEVLMDDVVAATMRAVKQLSARDEGSIGRIDKVRNVNHKDPVIAGTRVRVRAVQRFSKAGYTPEQILKEYPDLTERDVMAALEYGETRAVA
jgi:uncharacterized protein (DUF433 family)